MKKSSIVAALLGLWIFSGCETEPVDPVINNGTLITRAYEMLDLSNGSQHERYLSMQLFIFDERENAVEINSYDDLLEGRAFVPSTQLNVSNIYSSYDEDGTNITDLEPGNYLVSVIELEEGRWSYIHINVESNERLILEKEFDRNLRFSYDEW
ncbi:MAG: hypothetical protein JXR07_20640 [Reichenbachiella sp.]